MKYIDKIEIMLLETTIEEGVFGSDELSSIETDIMNQCTTKEHSSNNGKLYGNNHQWDFYNDNAKDIRNKLEKHIPSDTRVARSHILESFYPYEIHTDVNHSGSSSNPQYTFIIPLEDYESETFVFNEYATGTNEFEDFKTNYTGEKKLRIPKDKVLSLTHIHPKDIMYLSLKETFAWNKGSIFGFDRKYFHCSDNYMRSGLKSKRAIILWTDEK